MRVKFYGADDMSYGHDLIKAAKILETWDGNSDNADINFVIELYNIKKCFETGFRPSEWDNEFYENCQTKVKGILRTIGRFCATISEANLDDTYKMLDQGYKDDFWQLFCNFKIFQRVDSQKLSAFLEIHENALWHIIHHKPLVQQYGQVLAQRLSQVTRSAEWLISYFLARHENPRKDLYFPSEFTQEMRDKLLTDYVDSANPNPNYLRLLELAQSSAEFPIQDKLKLKAKRKGEELRDKLFSKNSGLPVGVEIRFKSMPEKASEFHKEEHVHCWNYSHEWVEENADYPTLLNNFIHLFDYVDDHFRCSFVSLKSKLGVFERHLGVKGKKEYETGIVFQVEDMQSTLQLQAYRHKLLRIGIRLEDIFKWFFETYLPAEFNASGFSYQPPSDGTTRSEKCKLLASSIDGVLKQYRLFCEDGYVDRELLEISSNYVVFSDLPSMQKKKYLYSNSSALIGEQHFLYSDQSHLTFTEKTQDRYDTLPKLLLKEELTMDDFYDHQKGHLQHLIDRGVIIVQDTGRLTVDAIRAFFLKELFEKEVICFSYFDEDLQKTLNHLIATGDLRYANTLFSEPEQKYLNYMLNKSEFSNGLDLRNKYIHDTGSLDENIQEQDYVQLLKIMVLIIIKINEEFCLRDEACSTGTFTSEPTP